MTKDGWILLSFDLSTILCLAFIQCCFVDVAIGLVDMYPSCF